MLTSEMLKELSGEADLEREATRRRNQDSVVAGGIAKGYTANEIINLWADEMDAFGYDWLDIPDCETYCQVVDRLYFFTHFDEDDENPWYCRFWDKWLREYPDCPIIAALYEDRYCEDVAEADDPETDVDVEALVRQHQVALLEELGIRPDWARAHLHLYQHLDLDFIVNNKRTAKRLIVENKKRMGNIAEWRAIEEDAQLAVDSWGEWWIHWRDPIRTLDDYVLGFCQWCQGVKHSPLHRLGDPLWDFDSNGLDDDIDPWDPIDRIVLANIEEADRQQEHA
jgi:hypothetical protein